jgi:hypothetical protein
LWSWSTGGESWNDQYGDSIISHKAEVLPEEEEGGGEEEKQEKKKKKKKKRTRRRR